MIGLKNSKKSLQMSINEFFKEFNMNDVKYQKSSYTKARAKISPSLFVGLNDELIDSYYGDNEGVKLYKGFRVFAIDGSTMQLPNIESLTPKEDGVSQKMREELRSIYGYTSDFYAQYESRAKISLLEDVENQIIHQGIFNSYNASEKEMAYEHIEYLAQLKQKSLIKYNDLIIFDRGYPSYALISFIEFKGIEYLMRIPKNYFKEIEAFRNSKANDSIITIELTKDRLYQIKRNNKYSHISSFLANKKAGESITLRAIKVKLPTGEIELLITSLLDKKLYKHKIFKSFYFKRWGIEESYKALKSLFEIENFTGITQVAINQDFFATLFSNMHSIMINAATQERVEEYNIQKRRKYQYKINRSFAISSMKDELIYLIVTNGDIEAFYAKMLDTITTNFTPIKPNRSFDRKRDSRHKFPINKKRVS
jgi:hypothetical protein